jgi:hypothetical protein
MHGVGITVTTRRLSGRGRKPLLCASVGGTLAVLAAAALPGAAGAATSASAIKASTGTAAVTLGATPLGVDIAPWDALFSNPASAGAVESDLKAAGIDQLHYGGGGTADQYDEQSNMVVSGCGAAPTIASFDAPCATTEPLDFAGFSAGARAVGAQSFATVNYGTGSPAMAAAWVQQSLASGQAVAQWSIGNESYGCWEDDNWLTVAPADDTGYAPNDADTCPMDILGQAAGLTEVADSYVANALPYMQEMTEVDPTIKLGVPWAFDWTVGGAAVGDNANWNDTILGSPEMNPYISFVEAHWYPYSFGGPVGTDGRPTAQAVIQSVEQIPSEYAKIRATLNQYDPKATVTVGETGVSYLATNIPCTPAGALFASGDVLSWLAAGAQSVDWWPLETNAQAVDANQSLCLQPEEGMFTSNGAPDTVYQGYLLASQLAQPKARLSSLTTSNPTNVLGFQSVLPDGQVAVALINTNTSTTEKVKVGTSLAGNLSTESYIPANVNAASTKIVDGTTTAGAIANGITLPPESILVLRTNAPSEVTLGAATSVKAGTKVTLSGRLTLKGTAAPAGVTVKIYRRVAGRSVNSAALTVKTAVGGTFTATDLPPAYGSYDYVASYAGSSVYEPASSTFLIHVTALKPALKLAFSAGSVRPGQRVTVTATLGAWHANRTLVIYAQPKGSAKKIIERGTVNSKGKLVVSFTVKANTTFTVAFAGDSWYASASATGIVKA